MALWLRKKINGAIKCCEADPIHLVRPWCVYVRVWHKYVFLICKSYHEKCSSSNFTNS